MTLKKDRGQVSNMNGDHKEIYEKIQGLELKVLSVKKDTKFIRKNFNDHLIRFEDITKRVRFLEGWRWKVMGATTGVSIIGISGLALFLKTIGIW